METATPTIDTLDSLTKDLQDKAPEPRDDVIEHLQSKAETNATGNDIPSGGNAGFTFSEPVPSNSVSAGEAFNPDIHEADENGNPRLTKDGAFRRKRGRKSGTNTVSSGDSGPAKLTTDYRGLAEFVCGVVFGGLSKTLGEHWKPDPEERSNIEKQTQRVMEQYQMVDIPPVMGLCICVGMYAMPRIPNPETQRRVRLIGARLGLCKAPQENANGEA